MRRTVTLALSAAIAASTLAALLPASQAAALTTASVPTSWRLAYQAHLKQANSIFSVSSVSRTDAWAIGTIGIGTTGYAVHFDGHRWRMVAVPSRFAPARLMTGTAANIWLAGIRYSKTGHTGSPEQLRWTGASWQVMPEPPIQDGSVVLATGNKGAWAFAGSAWTKGEGWHVAAAYWDGQRWSHRPIPSVGNAPAFASAPDGSAWVAGTASKEFQPTDGNLAIYHWTGSGWSRLTFPRITYVAGTEQISVLSASNIWISAAQMVGSKLVNAAWHWAHGKLQRLPRAEVGVGGPVAADSANSAWFGVLAYWTGTKWVYPVRNRCVLAANSEGVSPVPGTHSAWGADFCVSSSQPYQGEIEISGPTP